jgi:hypothetical protein
MSLVDRVILSIVGLGIWAWLLISILSSGSLYALSIDASDVDGLRSFVVNVVENCTVDGDSISC